MMSALRQFRRAPGRIVASILALALAVGAVGVLAVPAVSGGTLHQAVERDGLGDIIVDTTLLSADQVAAIATGDDIVAAEGSALAAVRLSDGFSTRLIGLDVDRQVMDRLQLTAGRLPTGIGEVVTSPALGAIGDTVVADGRPYEVVGHGGTLWWSGGDVLYADLATVEPLVGGTNRLTVTAADDSPANLRAISDRIRADLQSAGAGFAEFPEYLPDGTTPIDADIDQVSTLIGLLGVFAGVVALVLLAGTTNTLIAERSREIAVMRALGGRDRPLRRRLRRIAVGITATALVIGLPLGIAISNLIARMVLDEFVGITPDFAVDWWVVAASAGGALLGARLVAAPAARRAARRPLVTALRDRDAVPFGERWSHRLASRFPTGGLPGRIAIRSSVRRPSRTVAVISQIGAAVGAAFLVPSLVTSVNDFNTASTETWQWESVAIARDPGLPLDADRALADGSEYGIWTEAEVDDWNVSVFGLAPDSTMFATDLVVGVRFAPGERGAVLSAGFAERRGYAVGERIEVDLAPGPVEYTVVGTVDDHSRALYVDRDTLAADLGAPGMANTIWADRPRPEFDVPVAVRVLTADEITADDAAGRDAIAAIFGAIGAIVAGVAALAVLSSMVVSLFERRHELATMQALGATRRRLRGLLARELVALGVIGAATGLALGAFAARAIIGSFEASNAVDIGVTDAIGAIPFIVLGALSGLVLLAFVVVRSSVRRPVADTLRGAA